MNEERLREIYDLRSEVHDRAIKLVWECISDLLNDLPEREVAPSERYSLFDRIKPFSSLKRKAIERQVADEKQVFVEIKDIIGVRVVTNNLSDIDVLHNKIKLLTSLEYDTDSLQNYIDDPRDTGYRGIHFSAYCSFDHGNISYRLPCEVQLRTRFQDAWAVLSHHDIYKNSAELPGIVRKLSRRLADQLSVLDNIAQDIHDAVFDLVEAVDISDEEPITKEGLAQVYETRFGASLTDYQAQEWISALSDEEAETIGDAKNLLPGERDIDRMRAIYLEVRGRGGMPQYHILRYGAKIVKDRTKGYEYFRADMQNEYNAIMQIGKA